MPIIRVRFGKITQKFVILNKGDHLSNIFLLFSFLYTLYV